MCGIAGWVAREPREMPDGLAGRMLDTMVHRGPDDEGTHRWERGYIGMRRLSIIDLETGRQPIGTPDGRVQVVQNGEIYNFRELRTELESHGHRFRTQSDTEAILHAYRKWDLGAFERLRGMFATAIWDENCRRLTLARDPMGKKPLFYAVIDGVLMFASELKALLEVPDLPREIDRDAVVDYLLYGYVPHPHSIFSAVRKLEPGHYLTWHEGRVTVRRYWDLPFEPKLEGSEAELEERLAHVLDEAVRMRLVSDVPWGACLSGGVDSSTVVALMARHVSQPVKTFSIGFNEAEFSELEAARAVAQHVGTEHHELIVDPDATQLLDDLVWHLDEPFADSSAIPTYLVSKMAAEQVKMVLTGDGGDESFAGYTRYQRYLRLQKLSRWGGPVFSGGLQAAGAVAPGRLGQRLRWLGRRSAMGFPESYVATVAIAAPDLVGRLTRRPDRADYRTLARLFPDPHPDHPVDALIAGDIRSYLTDDICVKVDRMSMAVSLEARCPLLDAELVRFAARLPQAAKTDGVNGKLILRRVAERLVPREILDRPKQGFAIPLAEWMRGPLYERASDLLRSRRFAERGLFDAAEACKLLDAHRSGQADYSEELWSLLCFEIWAQRFVDADQPPNRRPQLARVS